MSVGLYYCEKCDSYYQEPDEFGKALTDGCKRFGFYKAIIKCKCGKKRISGGEDEVDYINPNKRCIMIFGHDYSEVDKDLPIFDADMLTRCDENDSDCCASVFHRFPGTNYHNNDRVIHLKKGEPQYIFRNYPVTIDSMCSYQLVWFVGGRKTIINADGSYNIRNGVLEWCQSYDDAVMIYNRMKLHQHDDDRLAISIDGINRNNADGEITTGDTLKAPVTDWEIVGILDDDFTFTVCTINRIKGTQLECTIIEVKSMTNFYCESELIGKNIIIPISSVTVVIK